MMKLFCNNYLKTHIKTFCFDHDIVILDLLTFGLLNRFPNVALAYGSRGKKLNKGVTAGNSGETIEMVIY